MTEEKQILRAKEAARHCGMDLQYLYWLNGRGLGPPCEERYGVKLYDPAALEAWDAARPKRQPKLKTGRST